MLQQPDQNQLGANDRDRERREKHRENTVYGRGYNKPYLDMERVAKVQGFANYILGHHQKDEGKFTLELRVKKSSKIFKSFLKGVFESSPYKVQIEEIREKILLKTSE